MPVVRDPTDVPSILASTVPGRFAPVAFTVSSMYPCVDTQVRLKVVITVSSVAPDGTATVRGFVPLDSVQFVGSVSSTVWLPTAYGPSTKLVPVVRDPTDVPSILASTVPGRFAPVAFTVNAMKPVREVHSTANETSAVAPAVTGTERGFAPTTEQFAAKPVSEIE